MDYLGEGLVEALDMILAFDREFAAIVAVSLKVATLSTALATIAGVLVGIAVAEKRFRGRQAVITILHTLMSLPTVLVGLLVYSFISRRGPLGDFGLPYTQSAMVAGQVDHHSQGIICIPSKNIHPFSVLSSPTITI